MLTMEAAVIMDTITKFLIVVVEFVETSTTVLAITAIAQVFGVLTLTHMILTTVVLPSIVDTYVEDSLE